MSTSYYDKFDVLGPRFKLDLDLFCFLGEVYGRIMGEIIELMSRNRCCSVNMETVTDSRGIGGGGLTRDYAGSFNASTYLS